MGFIRPTLRGDKMTMSTSEKGFAAGALILTAIGMLVAGSIAYGQTQAEINALKENLGKIETAVNKQENLNRTLARELGVLTQRSETSITQGQLIQEQLFELGKSLAKLAGDR